MVEKQDTPIARLGTKVIYEQEIDRLRQWMKVLKLHTLDGSMLALIDIALDGKKPLPGDFKPDGCEEKDGMQALRWESDVPETTPTVRREVPTMRLQSSTEETNRG